MQTKDILTRVNEAINLCDSSTSPRLTLMALRNDLEAQIRSETANSKGVGNALKTVEKILAGSEKQNRRALAYAWIDSEGRQCVCDGFVAFRMRKHLPLPERPENAGDPIDLSKVFPPDMKEYKPLPMPSAKELKAFITIERAKTDRRGKDPLWRFGNPGEHAPVVNALYLLHAATIFPNAAEIFWKTPVAALYITCEDGDGVVLPVRVFDDETPEEKAQREAENEAYRKAEEERRENERKAGEEYKAAKDAVTEAQTAKNQALEKAEAEVDPEAKAKAMESYYDLCEAEGKARLRCYAAASVVIEDFDITTDQFEYIVKLLHAREYANR